MRTVCYIIAAIAWTLYWTAGSLMRLARCIARVGGITNH